MKQYGSKRARVCICCHNIWAIKKRERQEAKSEIREEMASLVVAAKQSAKLPERVRFPSTPL